MTDRLEGLDAARSVLLLAAPLDPTAAEVCLHHLAGEEGDADAVMNVLFTRRPDRRVENWRRHVGELPERFEVLGSQLPATTPEGVTVETLGQPGDLTGIGVTLTEHLGDWPADVEGTFCLHSITAQLQYAETDQVYQFLAALLNHLSAAGVVGHAHMNPGAHDAQTVETFKTLFDAVVEVQDGEVTVTTR